MNDNIFTDKTNEEAIGFYYSAKGVYTAKLNILQRSESRLDELLEFKCCSDKEEIKLLKEQIKKLKIEIETIEFLYECSFK